MTKTLVNQTQAIVWEEATLLLEHFPHRGYQTVIGDAELRQELIAYVLSRIPNVYAAQETDAYSRGRITAYRLQIEFLLQQGIQLVLAHQFDGSTRAAKPDKKQLYSAFSRASFLAAGDAAPVTDSLNKSALSYSPKYI